jgi:hypothetical protein
VSEWCFTGEADIDLIRCRCSGAVSGLARSPDRVSENDFGFTRLLPMG